MSSADRRPAVRLLLAAMALAICAPLLGACGFQPLYGSSSGGGSRVENAMAAVEIVPIPTRVGQRLRNELIFANTGGGPAAPSEYRLEISIKEMVIDQAVQITGEVGAQIYQLEAEFRLVRIADGTVLFTSKGVSRAPFDRVETVFANVRARQDAENRAANVVAESIKTRVAAFLSRAA